MRNLYDVGQITQPLRTFLICKMEMKKTAYLYAIAWGWNDPLILTLLGGSENFKRWGLVGGQWRSALQEGQ